MPTILCCGCFDFYPRSPCGERRRWTSSKTSRQIFLSTLSLRRATGSTARARKEPLFLSTLSLRRATAAGRVPRPRARYFYPRSPCGERQIVAGLRSHTPNFYPRSPCGERPVTDQDGQTVTKFLSTLSLRRATKIVAGLRSHTPNFYPRSPCGERLPSIAGYLFDTIFLSTLSLRRATCQDKGQCATR